MKKIIKALVVASALGFATAASAASMSIGVVDMQNIIKQAPQAQKLSSSLQKQFATRKNDLSKMQAALQTKMQNFEKNKPTMSAANAKATEKAIAQQSADLNKKAMAFRQDVMAAQNKAMNSFMNSVEVAIAKVAKADKLDLVVPKNVVLYSDDDMNITKEVLKQLDS